MSFWTLVINGETTCLLMVVLRDSRIWSKPCWLNLSRFINAYIFNKNGLKLNITCCIIQTSSQDFSSFHSNQSKKLLQYWASWILNKHFGPINYHKSTDNRLSNSSRLWFPINIICRIHRGGSQPNCLVKSGLWILQADHCADGFGWPIKASWQIALLDSFLR